MLKSDGALWVWGDIPFGQLGDGTTTDRHSLAPNGTAIELNLSPDSMAAGFFHPMTYSGSPVIQIPIGNSPPPRTVQRVMSDTTAVRP